MDQVHPDQVGPEVVIGVSARNWLIERDALLVPRYVNDDVERQWTSHKPDGKDTISWEEYRFYTNQRYLMFTTSNEPTLPHRQNVYGFLDEEDAEEEEHGFSYKQMEARDSRRWSMADLDNSGELDIQVAIIKPIAARFSEVCYSRSFRPSFTLKMQST